MSQIKPKMYSIFSGNLRRIGWAMNEETKEGTLRAEFQNQQQYDYWPVSQEKFKQIFSAESRGKWFDSEIKKNLAIQYKKVPEEEKTE